MKETLNERGAVSSSRRCIPAAFFVTALTVCLFTMPANAEKIFTGDPVNLELADADLETVLTQFSAMTGFVFAIDPQTAAQGGLKRSINVLYESTPWDQVMDEILSDAGLEWTLEGSVLWVSLPGNGPTGDRNFTGDPIKLRLKDADIRAVMANFSQLTGYAIELDPGIQSTVTLRLDDVPWDQVLDFILRISGLGCEIEGQTLRVFQVTEGMGRQLLDPKDFD